MATRGSIAADYRLVGSDKPRHLTNVYGLANIGEKAAFLRNLEFLDTLNPHNKWIIGGDFNIIRSLEEKRGGSRRLDQETNNFNRFIDKHRLIDLETINGIHTWTNKRTGTHQIACRLDQFLISDSLMLEGTTMEASILDIPGSNHWPIQLWLDVPTATGKKPFRFE
jgi:exonuclease III